MALGNQQNNIRARQKLNTVKTPPMVLSQFVENTKTTFCGMSHCEGNRWWPYPECC